MRRLRGAYGRMSSFEALWRASRLARRGKRRTAAVAAFEHDLERELLALEEELAEGRFAFSGYRVFIVREPAVREIRAAPYRDRVVHHAICAELEPLLERYLIHDTYACRVGKGTHRALDRLQHFLRGGEWVAKVDVRKYFFSIDHEILLGRLRRMIDDERFMGLLEQLLATYDAGPGFAFAARALPDLLRPRGLPIGNLTSQLLANFFLEPVDRFIKEELKVRRYLRYMDDLVIVAPTRSTAAEWLEAVRSRLRGLRLKAHPRKTQILPVKNGVRFLGFRSYPHYRRILRPNLRRFRRRMRRYAGRVAEGAMAEERVCRSLHAWLGFAGTEEHRDLIKRILASVRFKPPEAKREFSYWVP